MNKNCVLLVDLNVVGDNTHFCLSSLFEHLIKKPTCYKGDTPTGIDHIKYSKKFYEINGFNGSNHHKMNIFRSIFAKDNVKTFYYFCYKKFDLVFSAVSNGV